MPANTVTYTDPTANLVVGTTYTYRVAATNLAGPSAWSNLATAAVTLPSTPVLTGALAAGPAAALTWAAVTGHNSYLLERSTDNGVTWAAIANPVAAAVSFSDSPLVAGTTYQYRLSAVNFAGNAVSNVVTVAVLPPDAATGLSATINGTGGVDLAWTLPIAGAPATSQSVQRSTDGGTHLDHAGAGSGAG